MGYKQQQAPGDLDSDGLRKFTQEQLTKIARATAEMEKTALNLQNTVDGIQTDVSDLKTALITEVIQSFGVALGASATPQNVASILVPAGSWELSSLFNFSAGGATTATDWISIMSSNAALSMATSITGASCRERRPAAMDYVLTQVHPPYLVTFAVATTVYARAQATWSTPPAYSVGGYIRAQKMRN